MAWVRLDDKFTSHPKVLALSDREFRVHLSSLCYAAEYKTDGAIPEAAWRLLGVTRKIADRLVAVGVWDMDAGTYVIHDFRVYNPSDPTAAERQRRFKESRSGNGEVTAESRQDNGQGNGPHARASTPVPVPSPSPNREGSPDGAPSLRAEPDRKPAKQRERDHAWDAADAVFGTITNPKERGKRNDAVKALRASLAPYEPHQYEHEMRWRKEALEASWGKPCTPHALATNWAQAERVAAFQPPPDPHQRPGKPTTVEKIRQANERLLNDTEFTERFGLFLGRGKANDAVPDGTLELEPGDVYEEAS